MEKRLQNGISGQQLDIVRSDSLKELAYESIREAIISGNYSAGEQLVEGHLAKMLGISRAPIREALIRLQEENLVEYRPRHGTFIREFTHHDIIDIYNLRLSIETTAIRLLIRKGYTPENIKELNGFIDKMVTAAKEEDINMIIKMEVLFHKKLCQLSGNERLISIFNLLSAHVRMTLALDNKFYTNIKDIGNEHIPIVESILTGDELNAVKVLQNHIISTVKISIENLGGDTSGLLEPLI